MPGCPLPSLGATCLPCGFAAGHDGECVPKYLARWATAAGCTNADQMDDLKKTWVRPGPAPSTPEQILIPADGLGYY